MKQKGIFIFILMGLYDLDTELHRNDAESRRVKKGEFDPREAESGRGEISATSGWNVRKEKLSEKYRKQIRLSMLAIGVIALISFLGATFVRIRQSLFSDSRVSVSVTRSPPRC